MYLTTPVVEVLPVVVENVQPAPVLESRFLHGSSAEPRGLPRAHDADDVRDVQRTRHERGDPGSFVSDARRAWCGTLATACRALFRSTSVKHCLTLFFVWIRLVVGILSS